MAMTVALPTIARRETVKPVGSLPVLVLCSVRSVCTDEPAASYEGRRHENGPVKDRAVPSARAIGQRPTPDVTKCNSMSLYESVGDRWLPTAVIVILVGGETELRSELERNGRSE